MEADETQPCMALDGLAFSACLPIFASSFVLDLLLLHDAMTWRDGPDPPAPIENDMRVVLVAVPAGCATQLGVELASEVDRCKLVCRRGNSTCRDGRPTWTGDLDRLFFFGLAVEELVDSDALVRALHALWVRTPEPLLSGAVTVWTASQPVLHGIDRGNSQHIHAHRVQVERSHVKRFLVKRKLDSSANQTNV